MDRPDRLPRPRNVLLPSPTRIDRPARLRSLTAGGHGGRSRILLLVRRHRGLGSRHGGRGERDEPDRRQSGQVRGHRRGQCLQLRHGHRVRRPLAGKHLSQAVPAGHRQPTDLCRRRQSRVHPEPALSPELPRPHRRPGIRRSIHSGLLLLHLDSVRLALLSQHLVRLRLGLGPVLRARGRLGRLHRGLSGGLPGPLERPRGGMPAVRGGARLAQVGPRQPCQHPGQVRLLPLSAPCRQSLRGLGHLPRRIRFAGGVCWPPTTSTSPSTGMRICTNGIFPRSPGSLW